MRRSGSERHSSPDPALSGPVVRDTLFSGGVALLQPRTGYRVNVDSLILGDYAAARRPEVKHLVDLGAGVGAVTLATARFGTVRRATLVEREVALAALAESNLARAGVSARVLACDVARGIPKALAGSADVVVSNPPFFSERASASPDAGRARARSGPLAPFLRAAAGLLARRGYAFFVHPAASLAAFLAEASALGLVAKHVRFVHAFATDDARIALIELRRAKPGGLAVAPPLVEWADEGLRSPELTRIVAGERAR